VRWDGVGSREARGFGVDLGDHLVLPPPSGGDLGIAGHLFEVRWDGAGAEDRERCGRPVGADVGLPPSSGGHLACAGDVLEVRRGGARPGEEGGATVRGGWMSVPLTLVLTGCATFDASRGHDQVDTLVTERLGSSTGWGEGAPGGEQIAERVDALLEDGLDPDRAVSIALIHGPAMQETYA